MSVTTVLLDINVFTAGSGPAPAFCPCTASMSSASASRIAQQTVAEIRYGAVAAGWGERRIQAVERLLHRSRVLPVDDETTWADVRLRLQCRALGHPLHQKQHVGDLWIAATAVGWHLPLVAHDVVFLDCPDLELLTELPHS
jgi:predicted nucleic acid-binding protein